MGTMIPANDWLLKVNKEAADILDLGEESIEWLESLTEEGLDVYVGVDKESRDDPHIDNICIFLPENRDIERELFIYMMKTVVHSCVAWLGECEGKTTLMLNKEVNECLSSRRTLTFWNGD